MTLDIPDEFCDFKDLEKYCPDFETSEIVSLVKRVKNVSWGGFLNSHIFSKWLIPLLTGNEYGSEIDRRIAESICLLLPGIDHDSQGFDRYQWSFLEASHPGRYLYMRSLKLKLMRVSTSTWQKLETTKSKIPTWHF